VCAANKNYLRMFVETASTSGVDFVILGYPRPPFPLPSNIRHVSVTWNQFVDLIADRLFEGKEPGDLRNASPYKIIDFKPLFANLFPKEVKGYDWWGHIDNDLVLSNATKFLTHSVLDQHDIISAIPRKAWGPFTLYRNNQRVNELFRLAELPLEDMFATSAIRNFDEWGCVHLIKEENWDFNSTMAGIITKQHGERLGLRPYSFTEIIITDQDTCARRERCGECTYANTVLVSKRGKEKLLCHYIKGKNFLEASLEDRDKMARLLEEGEFRVSHPEGFDFLKDGINFDRASEEKTYAMLPLEQAGEAKHHSNQSQHSLTGALTRSNLHELL
jgi:hypothetical protein